MSHTRMSHVTHVNVLCLTCECLVSHTRVLHCECTVNAFSALQRCLSSIYVNVLCHIHDSFTVTGLQDVYLSIYVNVLCDIHDCFTVNAFSALQGVNGCVMPHTIFIHVTHTAHSCVSHGSFMCVTWLFRCVTWFIRVCRMAHSCVLHGAFIRTDMRMKLSWRRRGVEVLVLLLRL